MWLPSPGRTLSVIGTWKDEIQQDDAAVAEYAAGGLDIKKDVCDRCPTRCMDWDGKKLTINNGECVRCMHCINVMPKALRPGKEKGATILIGAKAPIVAGALLSSVLIPFVPAAELFDTIKELVSRVWEFWDEYGKNRERVGELIQRVGMANFLDAIGLEPAPEMISAPRDNPYIFFQPKERSNQGDETMSTQPYPSRNALPISGRRIMRTFSPRSLKGIMASGSIMSRSLPAYSATSRSQGRSSTRSGRVPRAC